METLYESAKRREREMKHRLLIKRSVERERKKPRTEKLDTPYKRYRSRNAYSVKGQAFIGG